MKKPKRDPKCHNNPTWKSNKVSKRTYTIKKPNLTYIDLKNLKYTKQGFWDQKGTKVRRGEEKDVPSTSSWMDGRHKSSIARRTRTNDHGAV